MNSYLFISMIGSGLLSSIYVLLAIGKMSGDGRLYPLLGAIASICIIIGSLPLGAMQPIIFNSIWLVFSVMGFFKLKLPSAIGSPQTLWCAAFAALVATVILPPFSSEYDSNSHHALSALGNMGIVLYVGGYLLFVSQALNEYKFYLHNLVADCLFVGIILYTQNWGVLMILCVACCMSIYGLVRLEINQSKSCNFN